MHTRPSRGRGAVSVLITCEHGGYRIPPAYQSFFQGWEALLYSHRGYDPGALELARKMARTLPAALISSTTSRLLIDLNRSRGHPRLYSEVTRDLPAALRSRLYAEEYLPYRRQVESWVEVAVARRQRAIHISCHSFTALWKSYARDADVGLLYDPRRLGECMLCKRWQCAMKAAYPEFTVRRNYPYTGKSDGLPTYLRRRFPDVGYVGIELEINQKHIVSEQSRWPALQRSLIQTLRAALAEERMSSANSLRDCLPTARPT
jgi:predicted N-formylglutamate amidohydrolase